MQYIAQIRMRAPISVWVNCRVAESQFEAESIAESFAEAWLGAAEPRAIPAESQKSESERLNVPQESPKLKLKRHKVLARTAKWSDSLKAVESSWASTPEPKCRTCESYEYDPRESSTPFCKLFKRDTHRDDSCESHVEYQPSESGVQHAASVSV